MKLYPEEAKNLRKKMAAEIDKKIKELENLKDQVLNFEQDFGDIDLEDGVYAKTRAAFKVDEGLPKQIESLIYEILGQEDTRMVK